MSAGLTRVAAPAAEVAAAARARGATVATVGPLSERHALLAAIGRSLRFPAYYGQNLDALDECLHDLSWLPAGEVVLVWDGDDALRTVDPEGHRAVLEVLADAATPPSGSGSSARPPRLQVVLAGAATP